MRALLYHERSQLSRELTELGRSCQVQQEELCRASQRAIEGTHSDFGIQRRLARNVARLQGLIQQGTDSSQSDLVVGALVYLARCEATEVALRTALLITDVALSAPDQESAILSGYSPWPLSPDLTSKAESLLLHHFDQPLLHDGALIETSKRRRHDLSWLGTSGFFGRFCRDLQFLEGVLHSPDVSDEHLGWARAALSYLHQEDDAINDQLGLLGLCDDALMAALAADLIEPGRQPWQHLFDSLHAKWGFVDRLIIHDEMSGQPCSEFLLAMLSLTCPSLQNPERPPLTVLALPRLDSIPLILATMASLGEIQRHAAGNDLSPRQFRPGDTICVDGRSFAHYKGVRELHGEPCHTLQFKAGKLRYFPPSQRFRLRLAKPRDRATGAPNTTVAGSELPVSCIEYLLGVDPSSVAAVGLLTLLASPILSTEAQARNIRFSGTPLQDAVPMASWTGDRWREWSPSFVSEPPLLGVTGDLFVAADLLDSNETTGSMIVDMTGIRGRQPQAVRRISQADIPVLAVCHTTDTDSLELLREHDFALWEWTRRDLSEILVSHDDSHGTGPVARIKSAVRRTLTAEPPEIVPVSVESSVGAFGHLQRLQALSKDDGQSPPEELIQPFLKLQRIFFQLLRTLPNQTASEESEEVERTLKNLERHVDEAIFLQSDERDAIHATISSMREMSAEIDHGKLRLARLNAIMQVQPPATVIVRDRRTAACLSSLIEDKVTIRPVADTGSPDPDEPIIALGWHGRDRMARILVPPVSDKLTFLLYPVEVHWLDLTLRFFERERARRSTWQDRSSLFAIELDWPERNVEDRSPSVDEPAHYLDRLDWHETGARRESALRDCENQLHSGDPVDAHLVLFARGGHAFLTPGHRVALATEIVKLGDTGQGLKEVPTSSLVAGDLVVLPKTADRDLIRERADAHLPGDSRERAALWREALRRFCERDALDVRGLQAALDEAGCKRHLSTISSWISDDPRIGTQHHEDIDTIAVLTKDPTLIESIKDCKNAISDVRGAHQKAARELAEKILATLARRLAVGSHDMFADLDTDATILEIDHIDGDTHKIPYSIANRLLQTTGDGEIIS